MMIVNKSTESKASARDVLKNLSTQDFLNFGVKQIAYIRTVKIENQTAFAVHAADGTPLSVMEDMNHAVFTIRENDLEPVTVH